MKEQQRVRTTPRMSAPKLAEYVAESSAGRRERILRDQKFPPTFKQIRYRDAEAAIRAAVLGDDDVKQVLMRRAALLEARPARNDYELTTNRCAAQATRSFASLADLVLPKDAQWTRPVVDSLPLPIAGVAVSVHMTAGLQRATRRGDLNVGGVMAIFRKERALNERAASAAAELIRRRLEAAYAGQPVTVKAELCLVVDVFARVVYKAPARRQRLATDLESACREIAARWPTILGEVAA